VLFPQPTAKVDIMAIAMTKDRIFFFIIFPHFLWSRRNSVIYAKAGIWLGHYTHHSSGTAEDFHFIPF
jgi:hypothetical protein